MAPRMVIDRHGVLWLSGADGLGFLHRLTTASMTKLRPGHGLCTLLLSDTARVVDLLSVYAGTEGIAVVTSTAEAVQAVGDHLRRYVLYGDDVQVTDARDQVCIMSVLGGSSEVAAVLTPGRRAEATGASGALWRELTWAGAPVWWLGHPSPGAGGDDLVAPRGPTAEALVSALRDAGVRASPPGQWDAMRVARHLPAHGAESGVAMAANPLELGLAGIVDFEKGCYLGQEVVARLATYDKVHRQLAAIEADSAIAPGDAVRVPASARGRADYFVTTTAGADAAGDGRGHRALALVPRALRRGDLIEIGPGNVPAHILWSSVQEP